MKHLKSRLLLLASVAVTTAAINPVSAQQAATPISVKIGYFNLPAVRGACPEALSSENIKSQADAQLRRDLEEAQKRIQKMQDDKRPKEEVDKALAEARTAFAAKQQALSELVQSAINTANLKIVQTVGAVAKEKGLDLVVDGQGIYTGAERVQANAIDITSDVIKRLAPLVTPQVAPPPAKPSAGK